MTGQVVGRQVFSVVLGAIVALLVVWLEPFNLDDGTASSIHSVWGRVSAFGYPTEKSPKTAVVLIHDKYLSDVETSWPIPLADPTGEAPVTHGDIVSSLVDLKPKAIFLGFKYVANRDPAQSAAFAELLKEKARTTPIYIAANTDENLPMPALPELSRLAGVEAPKLKFVSVERGKQWGETYAYPIWSEAEQRFSAAAQMHRDLCGEGAGCRLERSALPLDPQWSVPSDSQPEAAAADVSFNCDQLRDAHPEEHEKTCVDIEKSAPARLLSEALRQTPFGPKGPVLTTHVPIITLDMMDQERVQEDIRDAVVFVGSNLGIDDTAESPLQGTVPVAVLHATAYDNLAVLGQAYVRAAPPLGVASWLYQGLVVLAVAVFVLGARVWVILASTGRDVTTVATRLKLAELGAQVGVLTLWLVIDIAVFHSGPWVWGGIFVALLSGSVIRSVDPGMLSGWRKGRADA